MQQAAYESAAPALEGPPTGAAEAARLRFQQFVAMREVSPSVADDLFGVLTTSRVVLLLDDSGSMNTSVSDPLRPAAPPSTRWAELLRLCGCVVDIVTSTTPAGVDCYFLNRPPVLGVCAPEQVAPAFNYSPPQGGTPLIRALQQIFATYGPEAEAGRRVIVVVITDGEPSDGSPEQLFAVLQQQRHQNIHVSIAECNDNEDEMAYLDGWDKRLLNFDNSDDFSMELMRVRAANGPRFRFTYLDYAVKIILGSTMRRYFNEDQALGGGEGCCAIA